MLKITVAPTEMWDEQNERFITTKGQELTLEHSLVSISKWESKWHVPFLDEHTDKTPEMMVDYIRCMTLTQNVDQSVYACMSQENMKEINDYISDSMSATFFNKTNQQRTGANREVVTSELIYYWMVALQIPFECQKWHINRLLTLIGICNLKNEQPKKMSKRELMSRNAQLNAARRAKYGTKG